jgi:hypothetical protein
MVEAQPEFYNSKPYENLHLLYNELQRVVDNGRLFDTLMVCARKNKEM